jgi:HlyD family secretion protein
MPRQTPSLIAVSLIVLVGLAGCGKKPPKADPAQQSRAVRVVRVEQRPITGALSASGDLLPREEAAVLPEVTGYRVARVLVDVGSYVRRGQTLVELDGALIRSQVAQQAALAAQAAVQAEQAEAEAARVAGLDHKGVLSQEQIEQRRFQARAARATANAQAAALSDVRTRAGKLAVTAPVSGLILERNVRPGDLSATGATPWFRIARDGSVELQAQLSEDDLARVRPGEAASVELPSGVKVQGTVRLISPQIDPQTKLGFVRITLPSRRDIRAGGFGRAVFAGASSVALAVPETAIRYDASGSSVMTVGADNRVKRVAVRTGARASGWVELQSGPPAGARIVAAAAGFLLDGDTIRPVEGAAR